MNDQWPRVLLSVFNSMNLINGIGERFFAILKTSMISERFLLSSRVHRVRLSRLSMYVWLLASLISLLQDCDIYSHKMPWCALLTTVNNYTKSWKTARLFLQYRDQDPDVQDQDQRHDALLNRWLKTVTWLVLTNHSLISRSALPSRLHLPPIFTYFFYWSGCKYGRKNVASQHYFQPNPNLT